jgi:hypothetical protein
MINSFRKSSFLRCSRSKYPAVRLINLISAVVSLLSSAFLMVYASVTNSQVLFHDGSLLHSKVQYTTVDYN